MTEIEMLDIPTVDDASMAFGTIAHLPNYYALPEEFRRHNGNDYCRAISSWFFSGAKKIPNGLEIADWHFTAKDGVDATKALRAIRACMASWEPKHEHKEAGCAFMLSEWFDKTPAKNTQSPNPLSSQRTSRFAATQPPRRTDNGTNQTST